MSNDRRDASVPKTDAFEKKNVLNTDSCKFHFITATNVYMQLKHVDRIVEFKCHESKHAKIDRASVSTTYHEATYTSE